MQDRHPAELYLEHCLTEGLSGLLKWNGEDETILPHIRWDGLWNVTLARVSLWSWPHDQGEIIEHRLGRLVELSRAYSAWRLWQLGTSDARDDVRTLLSQGRVHHEDMSIIDRHFTTQPAAEAA